MTNGPPTDISHSTDMLLTDSDREAEAYFDNSRAVSITAADVDGSQQIKNPGLTPQQSVVRNISSGRAPSRSSRACAWRAGPPMFSRFMTPNRRFGELLRSCDEGTIDPACLRVERHTLFERNKDGSLEFASRCSSVSPPTSDQIELTIPEFHVGVIHIRYLVLIPR